MKSKVQKIMVFVLISAFCAPGYAMEKDEKGKKVVLLTDKKEQSLDLKSKKNYGNVGERSFLTKKDLKRIQREPDQCGCCMCMCLTCCCVAKLGALFVAMIFCK